MLPRGPSRRVAKALELRPNYPAALNNLANKCCASAASRAKLKPPMCRQALAPSLDYVLAHNNLGIILHGGTAATRPKPAIIRRALAPHRPEIAEQPGHLLKSRGRLNEAADCYRAAL